MRYICYEEYITGYGGNAVPEDEFDYLADAASDIIDVLVTHPIKKSPIRLICTPKVRHFWRCIFLWVRQDEQIKNTVQNSK